MAVTLMRYLQWAEENDTGTATSNNAGGALVVYFAVAENSDVDAVSSASVISAGDPRGYPKFVADVIAEPTGGTLTQSPYPCSRLAVSRADFLE